MFKNHAATHTITFLTLWHSQVPSRFKQQSLGTCHGGKLADAIRQRQAYWQSGLFALQMHKYRYRFMIMEQDTPSIAVRLRWGGMRFLEKTKIQHFLLTSFQHLNDLYPCSRMANNLNFGNCYGLHTDADVVVANILTDFDGLRVCFAVIQQLDGKGMMLNDFCFSVFQESAYLAKTEGYVLIIP